MLVMAALSYGVFVLTAREGGRDNGCIVNTVMQQTQEPKVISVTVNKENLTCDMIRNTGIFNVSILSEAAPFAIYRHFGFQSGRDVQKFAGGAQRAQNGIAYVSFGTCGYLSGSVIQSVDLGSHMLFFAKVTEERRLSDDAPATYRYYHDRVKPKPQKSESAGYICRVCGYIYEGRTIPDDFVCPICKHGRGDFEKIENS